MANGDVYEGKWVKGKREGLGKYKWSNGDEFLGEFYDDGIYKGKFYKRNGEVVEVNMGGKKSKQF